MGSWAAEEQEAVHCWDLHDYPRLVSFEQVVEVEEESASQWEVVWLPEALVPLVDVQQCLPS